MTRSPQTSTSGRAVVVSGTSSGVGRALAVRLVDEGYRVIGIARSAVDPQEIGPGYTHLRADLSELTALPDLASGICREHGVPFALVNNAAAGESDLLPLMADDRVRETLELNLLAPILLTKHFVRRMISRRLGRIVNVTSVVASTGYRGLSVYGAAKSGLEGFTRSLARDVGPRGVTVNCVAPGFLDTGMTSSLGDTMLDRIRARSPLQRFATPGEVASAVSYLLSDDAAAVTGTVLTVDAGSTA